MAAIILSTLIATTLTSAISPVSATTYNIINSHAGSTFFDGFSYFGGYDNTSESLQSRLHVAQPAGWHVDMHVTSLVCPCPSDMAEYICRSLNSSITKLILFLPIRKANGDVFWVTNSSLSYVDANGRAIIKVDNSMS